jgi:DNA-binding NarL/FixJ family response regulator
MPIRILIVDDSEPWRRFVCSKVRQEPELQIICEATDGPLAVHKAKELKPDLILLDIGLPTLNGVEAARTICKLVPKPKILFLSQESSADVVLEALGIGSAFVLKADARKELIPAIRTVILGNQFLSSTLAGHFFSEVVDSVISARLQLLL